MTQYTDLRPLSQRQETVLKFVIDEYTQTVKPVSSAKLATNAHLGLSSASFRIILSELEELGHLTHPHTSAGKVPTDQGYRYFVDHLLGGEWEPLEEGPLYQALQGGGAEDLFKTATRLLANLTMYPSMLLAPRMADLHCEAIELSWVGPNKLLITVVAESGRTHVSLLLAGRPVNRDEADRAGSLLQESCAGHRLSEMKRIIRELSEDTSAEGLKEVLGMVYERGLDGCEGRSLVWYGTPWMAQQPEFNTGDLGAFLGALEQGDMLLELMEDVSAEEEVTIKIGEELHGGPFSQCSVVASNYGVHGGPLGAIGIVGPRRMCYARAVTGVRALSRALSAVMMG